ncbi:MAG: Trm112 family protein [Pseudomonadota bacterium]|nr:Trm112 family protein [Pseudomonadota bacterium]
MSETPSTGGDFDFDTHFDQAVDPRLLEVLVCPLTHGPLEYDRERQELISRKAGLAYPIRGGAPIMLPEEARTLGASE